MFRLDKKVAFITGGASGIGKAVSLLFAKQGAVVCIIDLDENAGAAVVKEIKSLDGVVFFMPAILRNMQRFTR